jgi:hypothetical protein
MSLASLNSSPPEIAVRKEERVRKWFSYQVKGSKRASGRRPKGSRAQKDSKHAFSLVDLDPFNYFEDSQGRDTTNGPQDRE